MKNIKYVLQAVILYVLFFIFWILPIDAASALGALVGRCAGRIMGATGKARKNLSAAMPELNEAQKKTIIRDMWDNLGRTFAEYPHLEKIAATRTTIDGQKIIDDAIAAPAPFILVAAHLANWEVNGAKLWVNCHQPLHLTYRAMNNPYADALLMKARTLKGKLPAYPKARDSGRQILMALKNNQILGILIDQKYNEGVAVPFFGRPAMTNPVFVQLAQKFKCPVIPVQAIRTHGAHFHLKVHAPLTLFDAENKPLPVETVIGQTHLLLERWVRENPGQWLWLHRRWDSKALKEAHEQAAL